VTTPPSGTDQEPRKLEDWWQFLAEAGDALAASLDFDHITTAIAGLAVPRLADWCAVHVTRADGSLEALAVAHRDAARTDAVRELRERFGLQMPSDIGVPHVISTGKPELYESIDEELLSQGVLEEEQLELFRTVGLCSMMIVPLTRRDIQLGALIFAYGDSRRHYDRQDLARGLQLGARAALAVENARLYRDAQRSAQARETFLSIASHELRSPLTSILGFGQRLERRAREGRLEPSAEVLGELRLLTSEARRMQTILEQLLDLTRIGSSRLELVFEPHDVAEVVRREVESLKARVEDVTVGESLPAEELLAEVDPVRVSQIIANLLDNAVKYGGSPPSIEISARVEEGSALVQVRDNGEGVPELQREAIFELFVQGEERRGGGLGVGLWLARQFAERMGGSLVLEADSERTCFTLRLPSAQSRSAS
jgi:signal transduction histidine kinase